jgi:hypothetical protein
VNVVEAMLSWIGWRRNAVQRSSVADLLKREALAEQQAEAALNGMRAVRMEYDPRCRAERRRRLDSINARIEAQQEAVAALKGRLSNG